jgi:hypothetical protein
MTDFDLGERRFALIFSAFRAFQHLLTVPEQLAALACVKRHLAPGGLFVFDMFAPLYARLALEEEPEHEDVRAMEGDIEVRRFATVTRDIAAQVLSVRFRHERWRAGVKLDEGVSDIRLRWFFRYEVEHLLARAGFEVAALYGGFDKRAFDAKGEMITVARVR